MMKKLLSLFLGAALLMSAVLPAALAAEDAADAKLTQVTQTVKDALELNTEDYSYFQGNYEESELTPLWDLYWEGDAGSLSVTALEDGTIISYSLSSTETNTGSQQGLPAFPQGDEAKAGAAARAFLDKVLAPGLESVVLEEPSGLTSLDSTTFRYSGTILLNGLPSPLTYSLTIRSSDNQVTRFRRDAPETMFRGDIPGADARTGQADAAAALKTTLSLRLEYILPDSDSTQAVLCYLPNAGHEFYVDAGTGELVDLTALEEEMLKSMGMGGAAEGDSGASQDTTAENGALTDAEQAGIAQMEGVLSSQKLDGALRAVSEYGLTGYELVSARFSVGEAEGDEAAPVTCVLRYSRSAGEDVYTRTFTVDARTGEVQYLYAYLPWDEDSRAVLTEAEAQAKAEAFLEARYGDRFSHLALYETPGQEAEPLEDDGSVASYSFRFARQENGYFFPDHYYTVRVDSTDGSVCGLSYWYDEEITFASPAGVISADAALDAWMDTYDVTLGYLLAPQKLTGSDPVIQRLEQMGLTAFYYLKLGYGLEREESFRGIDAKSGEPMGYAWRTEDDGLAYSDVAGSWVEKDVLRLARFNVGYAGGVFQQDKSLTQWDLVCLLYSLSYYPLDPGAATEAERGDAYAAAYRMGALARTERDDDKVLTRGELVRYLLNAAGYGPVARLEGIFTCSYSDRDAIPESDLGYAALAQGLGLISGAYAGASAATRGQAAAMLCRLMER